MKIVVAMTGASGTPYGLRLLELLANTQVEVHLSMSDAAAKVLAVEQGLHIDLDQLRIEDIIGNPAPNIRCYHYKDLTAPMASGSAKFDAMVIVPCSGGTLGRVANGVSDDLITRAADVFLKERRKLILVTRETPLSLIHLRNMVTVTEAGAVVMPASPNFYHCPKTKENLIDTVVSRILDHLGVESGIIKRWGE